MGGGSKTLMGRLGDWRSLEGLEWLPIRVLQASVLQTVLHNDVAHFVAAAVEGGIVGLGGGRLPEREEEHSPLGAEGLLVARRMPSCAEAFGRQYDNRAPGPVNGVAAFLLAWTHEGADAGATRTRAPCAA